MTWEKDWNGVHVGYYYVSPRKGFVQVLTRRGGFLNILSVISRQGLQTRRNYSPGQKIEQIVL
jgi:hypothetical protein